MHEHICKSLPRNWARLCIINLLIAAFVWMLMSYKIVYPFPMVDQIYLLHAHPHFVFCGWASLTLFSCIVAYTVPNEVKSRSAYRVMFFLLEIASVGMLITFLYQGYSAFSLFFSFLFTIVFYWSIIRFWKGYKKASTPREIQWFIRMALIWLVISSFGPYLLGYLNATNTGTAIETRATLYFYLHFQYNGWFTFAIFGLLLHWLQKTGFLSAFR